MIITRCPHCQCNIAIDRDTMRKVAAHWAKEEESMLFNSDIPPLDFSMDIEGEVDVPEAEGDTEFLKSIGVHPNFRRRRR